MHEANPAQNVPGAGEGVETGHVRAVVRLVWRSKEAHPQTFLAPSSRSEHPDGVKLPNPCNFPGGARSGAPARSTVGAARGPSSTYVRGGCAFVLLAPSRHPCARARAARAPHAQRVAWEQGSGLVHPPAASCSPRCTATHRAGAFPKRACVAQACTTPLAPPQPHAQPATRLFSPRAPALALDARLTYATRWILLAKRLVVRPNAAPTAVSLPAIHPMAAPPSVRRSGGGAHARAPAEPSLARSPVRRVCGSPLAPSGRRGVAWWARARHGCKEASASSHMKDWTGRSVCSRRTFPSFRASAWPAPWPSGAAPGRERGSEGGGL